MQKNRQIRFVGNGNVTIFIAIFSGIMILAINMGLRQAMLPLFIPDMVTDLGWRMGDITLAFAVQNLVWGGISPIAGLAAERYGTVKTLMVGALIYGVGLLGVGWTENFLLYQFANGILIGVGVGITTFPVVLAAVGRMVPVYKRSFALGLVSAGASLGQFVFAILTEWALTYLTWVDCLFFAAFIALSIILFAPALYSSNIGDRDSASSNKDPNIRTEETPVDIKLDRRFTLLTIGFFVCGFHISFIAVHLPNFVAICNLPSNVAANSLAIIGLGSAIGGIVAGWLGGLFHKPYLLSIIYMGRVVAIIIFMLAAKTALSFYIFSIVMGALWLSTVPLTSGAIAQFFGTQKLGSLFGFVMFSHQIGAFFGAWLSGILYDMAGDYTLSWIISILLGIVATLIHLPIRPISKPAEAAVL